MMENSVIDIIIIIITHCPHYQHYDCQEPSAYFENTHDFVDNHDYSIICYPIIYATHSAHA